MISKTISSPKGSFKKKRSLKKKKGKSKLHKFKGPKKLFTTFDSRTK